MVLITPPGLFLSINLKRQMRKKNETNFLLSVFSLCPQTYYRGTGLGSEII